MLQKDVNKTISRSEQRRAMAAAARQSIPKTTNLLRVSAASSAHARLSTAQPAKNSIVHPNEPWSRSRAPRRLSRLATAKRPSDNRAMRLLSEPATTPATTSSGDGMKASIPVLERYRSCSDKKNTAARKRNISQGNLPILEGVSE